MNGMPDGTPNSPDEGKEAQIWERPWSLEEMRQSAGNWSLAADSGLLLFLQDFSQRMLSKTHEMEKQLDSLIRDTKATDSSLHSVFNDFLMLSNTQFIENRVYDEEVEEPVSKNDGAEKQPDQKSRVPKESELIPKMQQAVNFGLGVLESAFEHLDIKAGNSDSEDEEGNDRLDAILEPKDLYVDRPLPLLIGSQAFMEQEDVGLGDLSSDELSVDSERDSVIDSEDDKDAQDHSDEDFMQEDDDGRRSIRKSSMLSYEEDDDDSDIFGESDKEEENTKNAGPSSFADELAARIKGELVGKPTGDRASLSSRKKSKSKNQAKPTRSDVADDDSDDMFKPPEMDDDKDEDHVSPFGTKSGLFSGGKGLFDDDDEGDLFSNTATLPVSTEEKSANESIESDTRAAEPEKSVKKVPAGAVSIFPGNSLFGPVGDLTENGATHSKSNVPPKQAPTSGGLFDEEDDDDDFFSAKNLKNATQEKAKAKISADLFNEDDKDRDIFGETADRNKKVEEPPVKPPEKKMPAGAVSMFGPGTKNLLTESLKKRHLSSSEESEKSEKNGSVPNVSPAPTKKPLTSGIFSDDDDTQIFATIPRSQSLPQTKNQSRISKQHVTFFDDDHEEDLFASASKSKAKPKPANTLKPQPTKAISGSLFSDDEDQWLSPKTNNEAAAVKSGGEPAAMKSSVSAPSGLTGVAASPRSSLFDDDDDDDLFSPPKELSQKKPRKVTLLFEDDHDEDTASLFGIETDDGTNVATKPNSMLEKSTESAVKEKLAESKKIPVGGVSVFGGIGVLPKKSILDGNEDLSVPKANVTAQEKVKTKALSLFNDDDDEDDERDFIFPPSKPVVKIMAKPTEKRAQTKSTGVFLNDELLFSPTQQKDNHPDVDLFASSDKNASSKISSGKPTTPSLFAEDEEDDLFGSGKTQFQPLKVAEKPSGSNDKAPPGSDVQKPAPSTIKEPSSKIGKLQASLKINPAMFLPGSTPAIPGAVSVLPVPEATSSSSVSSSSVSPGPATTPSGEAGLSFDAPVQISLLHSANKGRVKGSQGRRPPSRAARLASQRSAEQQDDVVPVKTQKPASTPLSPSLPTLPVTNNTIKVSNKARASTSFEDDIFASESIFGSVAKAERPSVAVTKKDMNNLPSIFDHDSDDLFRTVKPKTAKALPFLEDDDIFAEKSSSASISSKDVKNSSFPKTDIFEDNNIISPKASKKDKKDKPVDVSLFDDNVDIFADLSDSFTPKQKTKTKAATVSIFDDDMDDIFAPSTVKTTTKSTSKTKRKPPTVEPGTTVDSTNIFDDPLNVFGSN
ncbi:WASH complex subunit 2A isoform X2 [Corythoichthys intestinalis]|uniref:WASH complex subunit 2A isoform X2 n=1 Tax=Corythoichthys intestinalis TaxID=161448 RepID=UPI0025A5BC6A|nr:WASH complex subunit 2A isoform X2 [Corythoichthys intestinalis]